MKVSISSTSEEVRDLPADRLNQLEQTVQVSISSTSEEVRDVDRGVHHGTRPILVSISSTSEEVRDEDGNYTFALLSVYLFPLVPLPKKCVTIIAVPIASPTFQRMFPLVPLPKKCVT